MSERTTAEIVADLRDGDAVIILRSSFPVCPTCGGTHAKSGADDCPSCDAYGLCPSHRCPDCTDGRMPFERMARIVVAVFDANIDSGLVADEREAGYVAAYNALRGIR